ncbi:hypothetical protein CC86DRAFT_429490 [Ophiobolus disseminans]|uniref:Uncharacterized protein n=1 Tax=Ophiobolus disseminans TaxID=1469910 RepID=A0A6A6ZH27_9PLEO|nr:hypothetical protein CC86DRAFT_429490 [Ophiobolus disseminans]
MQRSHPSPSAAQPPAANIPIILVEDQTVKPITTTNYIRNNNEIDFEVVYRKVKSLLPHKKCSHRSSPTAWPCTPCDEAFSNKFWSCAAHLLDYFADFLHVDTPTMHVLWFHLVDIWQQTADWFPIDAALENRSVSPESMQAFTKARWFTKNFEDTIRVMNTVIYGGKDKDRPREPIIHKPSGDHKTAGGEDYNTGPYYSGLRPWEQWLCRGGSSITDSSKAAKENVRHIPTGAIAIMKTHTERAELLAVKLNPGPEFLAAFKRNSLVFPQEAETQSHSYTSRAGTTISYHLENGAPPVMRPEEFGDLEVKATKPSLHLLDEFIGRARGMEAYEPVSGIRDQDGEWEDGFAPFDTWVVTESKQGDGGEDKMELAEE